MVLWHVTSLKKVKKYHESGGILPPVRAWKTIEAARRFSLQTGRRIVLRLRGNQTFSALDGHRGEAVVSQEMYRFKGGY